MEEEKLYTAEEVAQMLQVHKGFVYRLISEGRIKSVKLGKKSFRFKKSFIDEYLNQNTN